MYDCGAGISRRSLWLSVPCQLAGGQLGILVPADLGDRLVTISLMA